MSADELKPGAVLQFEIRRKRWGNSISFVPAYSSSETSDHRLRAIAQTCAIDVIRNNGTLVIIATDEKVTIIQRPDAVDIEDTNDSETEQTK